MTETDPKNPSKPKRFRIFIWIVATGAVALVLFGLFLLAVNAYVNSAGRIPDDLRADPAAIAAMRTVAKPTPRPTPKFYPNEKPPLGMAEIARRDPDYDVVYQLDRLGRELDRISNYERKLSKAQADWLEAHAGLIQGMHELIRSGDAKKNEAIFACADNLAYRIFQWHRLLLLDTQRLAEKKDYAAAHQSYLDALKYLDLASRYESRDQSIVHLAMLCGQMQIHGLIKDIQDPDWPDEHFARIPQALEALDIKLFDRDAIRSEQIEAYLAQRRELVNRLDHEWYNPLFGWPGHGFAYDTEYFHHSGYYWPIVGDEIQFPNIKKYMTAATTAMANKKRAAESLKNFDAEKQRIIQRFSLTYPELNGSIDAAEKEMKKHRDNCFFDIRLTEADAAANSYMIHENTVHLARVGLLYRLNPDKAKAMRTEILQRHNPWRDPFSEKPYFIEETTSGTLIYGQGWRLKPEDGRRQHSLQIHVPAQIATNDIKKITCPRIVLLVLAVRAQSPDDMVRLVGFGFRYSCFGFF